MAPYEYPGVDLQLKDRVYNVGDVSRQISYDICGCEDYDMLPLREVFMINLMDSLTDKPNWHVKVFDEKIVSKWRAEALSRPEKPLYEEITSKGDSIVVEKASSNPQTPEGPSRHWWFDKTMPFPRARILSPQAFDYCIRELREKAVHFQRSGFVPALDATGRAVIKSDGVVGPDLKARIRAAFRELRADQAASPSGVDWHPNTNSMVQDLVHPSMYPFSYQHSRFIQDEVVGLEDAVRKWAGKGAPLAKLMSSDKQPDHYHDEKYPPEDDRWPFRTISHSAWSDRYQWLPANLEFQEDGSARFTSYVNNLHPGKYTHIYRALEELINLAIPAWDQALHCARQTSRFSVPKEADDTETGGLWEPIDEEITAQLPEPSADKLESIRRSWRWEIRNPDGTLKYADDEDEDEGEDEKDDNNSQKDPITWEEVKEEAINHWKWRQVRDAIYPEPDIEEPIEYSPQRSIREMFKDSGLQVVVKLAHIQLTPEKPEFGAGNWHVEGMMNDRICATALYYLDSENITTSSLAFRTTLNYFEGEMRGISGQGQYNWLERVYGTDLGYDGNCVQYYGHVETGEGRMLAFPNAFQHRVSSFRLKDPSKPGHRSFIALWLVDPTQRIISTANVPPQQFDWWKEQVLEDAMQSSRGDPMSPDICSLQDLDMNTQLPNSEAGKKASTAGAQSRLPPELMDMIMREVSQYPGGLMTRSEAEEHRTRLMEERTVFDSKTNGLDKVWRYNFCEH